MSLINQGLDALGRLALLTVLLGVFLASMVGVVYMSLNGDELVVPDLVGKDFVESERELAALGLRLKRRADRPSPEKINTVLEQLPRAGESVKTGQLILVVVSKAGVEPDTPKSLIEDMQSDDSEKIEEMISDKPKKAKTPTNTNSAKKTADTTRDVIANTAEPALPSPDATKPADQTEKNKPAEAAKTPEPRPAERNRNAGPRPQQTPQG